MDGFQVSGVGLVLAGLALLSHWGARQLAREAPPSDFYLVRVGLEEARRMLVITMLLLLAFWIAEQWSAS